jgi:hypothetical protein
MGLPPAQDIDTIVTSIVSGSTLVRLEHTDLLPLSEADLQKLKAHFSVSERRALSDARLRR